MPLAEPKPGSARDLVRSFGTELRTHMAYPIYFLQQAAAALDGGSTIGTSLLCRAALEAAYCQFLPGQRELGDRVNFGGVMRAIKGSKLLDVEQLLASERIRHNGNWVAHVIQISEKERQQSSDPLHWTPWIDETRARADLVETLGILRTVENAFPSIFK